MISFHDLQRIANRIWWRHERIREYGEEIAIYLDQLDPTELRIVDALVRGDDGQAAQIATDTDTDEDEGQEPVA